MASRKRKDKKKRPIGRPHRPANLPPRPADTARELTRRYGRPIQVIHNAAGQEKMSEVLYEFLEPYLDQWNTVEEFRRLVAIGAVAWNAGLLRGAKREDCLRRAESLAAPEGRVFLAGVLHTLVQRKLTRFADNTWTIIDYRVTEQPDGSPHLTVVSTLPKPSADPDAPPQ